MAPRKRKVNKEALKRGAKKCKFCPCDIYELLDVHRILEGQNGGKYEQSLSGAASNCVVVCSNCHRKIHSGLIKIDRWYSTLSGKLTLHYWEDGVERWD